MSRLERMFDTSKVDAPAAIPPPDGVEEQSALLDEIVARQRSMNADQAAQLAAIARLYRSRMARECESYPWDRLEICESVTHEVACALHVSAGVARARIELALTLAERLPATRAAFARGDIDWVRAVVIAEATGPLPVQAARAVEEQVLPRAPEQTPGQLRRALQRAVIAADPNAAEARLEAAKTERKVVQCEQPDGMAGLWALLPADGARTVMVGLTALAHAAKTDGDTRTVDQRRADALVDVFANILDQPTLPATRLGRPHVLVTVPFATLARWTQDPGLLDGYGPIPATMARDIAANGTWRCAVTDDQHGTVIGIGHRTYTPTPTNTPGTPGTPGTPSGRHGEAGYQPSAGLARLITQRDQRCRFPGCAQPAHRCDLDHRRPWPTGPTCDCNIDGLCRPHHRAKTFGGWRAQPSDHPHDPPATLTWTSPTGREYPDYPADTQPTRTAVRPEPEPEPDDEPPQF
jgi:hypothetical protein